jgi:hypothetical protein
MRETREGRFFIMAGNPRRAREECWKTVRREYLTLLKREVSSLDSRVVPGFKKRRFFHENSRYCLF